MVRVIMAPFFSVIIPAYNAAGFIASALESVFAQDFTDFEVIVVNDGSPDELMLEDVLAPFRTRIKYIVQENRGPSGARNTAIKNASGVYLAFLDADDQWEPTCLATHHKVLTSDPGIDVLYGDGRFFGDPDTDGQSMMKHQPSAGKVTIESLVAARCIVFLSSAVARREIVDRLGGFNESIKRGEDLDLWLRIVLEGGRVEFHREFVLRYRRHSGSLTTDEIALTSEVLAVIEGLRTHELTASQRQAVESRIPELRGSVAWYRGQAALRNREFGLAAQHWAEANRYRRSLALGLAVLLLRFAPGLFCLLRRVRAQWTVRFRQSPV